MSEAVGAIEIGGSHVSVARVDVDRACIEAPGTRRYELAALAPRDQVLRSVATAARDLAGVRCAGVATPGPFDYERGVALFRGVGKFDSLYGVDMRAQLAAELALSSAELRFLNDAHAFVLGEWWTGRAMGHARAMGVTLGTGLGSGFLVDGAIVTSSEDIPAEARLDLVPFRGGAAEDVFSSRGIASAFGGSADVAEIARRARAGERRAIDTFHEIGSALGEFLTPWIDRFAPTCLVFGGSITRAWDLFGAAFERSAPRASRLRYAGPALHLDDAPLLGAALHASRPQSEMS